MAKLFFIKQNIVVNLKEGTELLRLPLLDPKLPLQFGCCKGECGTCIMKVSQGAENLSPKTKKEQETLKRLKLTLHRLACQCALLGDVSIE